MCLFFTSKELDIIDDEDVDLAILLTELIDRASFDTRDIVCEESICCRIDDLQGFMFFSYGIRCRLEEMRLPESDISIEIERII